METIQEAGFLSPQVSDWITRNRKQCEPWFALCEDLNRVAQRLMLSLKPPKTDNRQLFVALLFLRIVSHFQATVILAERGLIFEARSIARNMLEATFSVGALCKDDKFASEYLADDEYQRQRLVKGALSLGDEHLAQMGLEKSELVKIRDEISAVIKDQEIGKLTTHDIAIRAGMLPMYNTLYGLLSRTVHSRVRDLGTSLEMDAQNVNVPEALRWGPDVEIVEVRDCLDVSANIIFFSLKFVTDFSGNQEIAATVDEPWQRYKTLVEERKKSEAKSR